MIYEGKLHKSHYTHIQIKRHNLYFFDFFTHQYVINIRYK